MNELLLLVSIVLAFGALVATSRFFGEGGVIAWVGVASILAEIAVTKSVTVFGLSTTLGNVMFASNFLATDILTELYGKKSAEKAVYVGIWFVLVYLGVTQVMLLYHPSEIDVADSSMHMLFGIAPRICIASVTMFFLSNLADVRLYEWMRSRFGGEKMWLRNNVCTMICNSAENFFFAAGAFWGLFGWKDIVSIAVTSSIIEIFVALCDTPFLYLARYLGRGPRLGEGEMKNITETA